MVFSFVPLVVQKVQKVESVNIDSDCKTMCKKRTDSSSVFTRSEKYKKVESVNTQNDYKTTSKKMNRQKENKLVL